MASNALRHGGGGVARHRPADRRRLPDRGLRPGHGRPADAGGRPRPERGRPRALPHRGDGHRSTAGTSRPTTSTSGRCSRANGASERCGRGGRSPGASGGAPAVRRGWRTEAASARTWSTWARRRRPASPFSSEYGRTASRSSSASRRGSVIGAVGQALAGQRPGDVGASLSGYREDLFFACDGSGLPGRPCRTRLRLPGGSARCTRAAGGGRGENRRASSRSAAGRAPSEVSQVAAEIGLQAADVLGDRVDGRDHPGKRDRSRRARGGAEDGVQRLAAVVAQQHSVRRGLRLSRGRRAGLTGTAPTEPGDLDRRAGAGDPRAGQDNGSPRARIRPVATPDVGACAASRWPGSSGRPRGLTPGTATAPRGPAASPAIR